MSEYLSHARREFIAAGWMDENGKYNDKMQQMMCEQVCKLLEMFGEHGHSGTTAPYAVGLFQKLAMFEPIVPLTGDESEWNEVGTNMWQNNRCSHVFKDADGRAYDINGRIFRERDGCCYISKDSHVYITFPYVPKSEYVDVR